MTTETAVGRLVGSRPGRARALLVSLIVGAGAGVITYKLLRSGGDRSS